VSRSFELFRVASVPTSQQHVRTPFSVWQVKRFSSQTRYGKTATTVRMTGLHHPDTILHKARRGANLQLSGSQGNTVRTPVLIMEIVCSWSATVETQEQHRLDAALFRKEYQRIWKVGCTIGRLDALSYRLDAA